VRQARLAEFREVLDDGVLPYAPDGLAFVRKVERHTVFSASQEHECVRPVGFDREVVGKERVRAIGDGQRFRELSCKQGVPCHCAERTLAILKQHGRVAQRRRRSCVPARGLAGQHKRFWREERGVRRAG
jgi:hypothetical protein